MSSIYDDLDNDTKAAIDNAVNALHEPPDTDQWLDKTLYSYINSAEKTFNKSSFSGAGFVEGFVIEKRRK